MLIILAIYAIPIYLIFGKFKLLPWNKTWKSITAFGALIIALVVVGALNYLAPSGRVTVQAATIEVTPNVSGTVVEVAVQASMPIEKGDLLFRIDPAPFQFEVERLEAAMVEAKSAVEMRQTEFQSVDAEIQGLEVQLEFGMKRRDDIVKLAERGVNSGFQLEEAIAAIEKYETSLRMARARKQGIELRIASKIDGVDSAVAQVSRSLDAARWKLDQTSVYASENGFVTGLALRPGDRVSFARSAMAFVPMGNRVLTGVFSQSGSRALEAGAEVHVAMRAQPGTYFTTTIDNRAQGTGEGTLQATGVLPRIDQLLGTTSVAVRLKIPDDLPDYVTKLGSSGSATLITPEAGPVAPIAKILFWVKQYTNYL